MTDSSKTTQQTYRDYIPEGEDTGPIGDNGFQDYIPGPSPEEVAAKAQQSQEPIEDVAASEPVEEAEEVVEESTEVQEVAAEAEEPIESAAEDGIKCTYCPFVAKSQAALNGHQSKHLKKEAVK